MTATYSVLAIDVGGTCIKASVLDRAGTTLRELERPTRAADGPASVVEAVRAVARELAGPDLAAAAVVVPGSIDAETGYALYSANLGWRNVPLRNLLAGDLGVPVAIEHDVRAAGLAERTLGAARDVPDCLMVVIGTGIAGDIRSAGATVRGATGLAGELGHLPVHPAGEPCACGQRGCLETYASGASIARRYRALTGRTLDAREIAAGQADDADARQVWTEATEALAIALATCTMLLDPAAVVIGGGLAGAGETLLAPVRTALAERLTWRPAPELSVSPLGPRAGQLGAAIMAWQSIGIASWSADRLP